MSRYWTLSGKPLGGWPDADTFVLRDAPLPVPAEGQALTRTIYISLDPYQWGYKRRGTEPKGAPCHARTISQVLESKMDGFAAGDFVFNTNGWAEHGLMGEGVWRPAYMVPRKLDPRLGRISYGVGVLGMLGLTAYAGLIVMAEPKAGETVVVSAASDRSSDSSRSRAARAWSVSRAKRRSAASWSRRSVSTPASRI